MKNKNTLAVILILLGIMLLLRNSGLFNGEFFLFIVSLGLFGGYLVNGGPMKRNSVGFLIPACIVLSIGIFTVLQETFLLNKAEGSIFFLLLGSSFFMIYFIHNIRFKSLSFGSRNWPAITGAALYIFGTLILMLEYYELSFVRIILQNLWPVTLILIGIGIILRSVKQHSHER